METIWHRYREVSDLIKAECRGSSIVGEVCNREVHNTKEHIIYSLFPFVQKAKNRKTCAVRNLGGSSLCRQGGWLQVLYKGRLGGVFIIVS